MMRSPMWDTSNAPERVLTVMCSSIMDVYWMGMSHPANQTILAPRATCSSLKGVLRMRPGLRYPSKSFGNLTDRCPGSGTDGQPGQVICTGL